MNLIPSSRLPHPFFDEIDRFLGRNLTSPEFPLVRVHEDGDAWNLGIDLPGFKREEIELDISEGYVQLKAKTEDEARSFRGTVEHRFSLPKNTDPSGVTATFENGVLDLHVPKRVKNELETRRIEIK